MKYYKDHTNPKYIGPGTWNAIHTIAFHARTLSEQEDAIKTITTICTYFPCETCRKHAMEYIKKNPMENYLIGKYKGSSGIFVWTVNFHNKVNYRIGSHIMSLEVAEKLYDVKRTSKKLCSKECSGEEPSPKKIKNYTKSNLKVGTLYMQSKNK